MLFDPFLAIEAAESIRSREGKMEQEFLREGEAFTRGYLFHYNSRIKKFFAEFLSEMSPFPTRYAAAQDALTKMTEEGGKTKC